MTFIKKQLVGVMYNQQAGGQLFLSPLGFILCNYIIIAGPDIM